MESAPAMKILLSKNSFKRNFTGIFALCMFMPMMPHGCSTMGAHKKHEEKTKVVDNKICPVSGQKIDEKTKVTYNYKGETYNFCCASCIDDFDKNPEKYIKKLEEEKEQGTSKQEDPSNDSHHHSH